MKFKIKSILLTTSLLMLGASIQSNAADTCPTCGGYFYTAVAQLNNGGIISNQYASRGPYGDYDSCMAAVNLDLGNNDSWLPYYGSPICTYRFETDYDAYDEILDIWNLSTGPSRPGIDTIYVEELIENIIILREEFDIPLYERKVEAMITDPEMIGNPELND